MMCLLQIILHLVFNIVSGHHAGPSGTAVTYEELVNLNANCPYIFCLEKQDNHLSSECDCGTSCVQLGTCCVDSLNRFIPKNKIKPVCRRMSQEDVGYFMVDQCPLKQDGSKSVYDDLCREEWNRQNDVMRIVPVTSLFTHITYKNFFCYRCSESGEGHMFWNVRVKPDDKTNVNPDNADVKLEYDKNYGTWYSRVGENGSWLPVTLNLEPPSSISRLTKICNPDLISDCSEYWQDEAVSAKCDAYMHVTHIARNNLTLRYRNPHCAFCNYEKSDNYFCPASAVVGLGGVKKPLSFTFLLDVNPSSGDKVGQIERCRGNDVWDPYFKKCRTLKCSLPGYVVRDGKCVPP